MGNIVRGRSPAAPDRRRGWLALAGTCLGLFGVLGAAPAAAAFSLSENFDGVVAPALPPGWTATPAVGAFPWTTQAVDPDSPPNAAFVSDRAEVTDNRLDSPVFVGRAGQILRFRHTWDFEQDWDGGVLEIRIGTGAFTDLLAAGGSFLTGGYNATLSTIADNPIGGRQAWSGDSGGYVTTTAQLPAAAAGQSVQLRWRAGTDQAEGGPGWRVDTVSVPHPSLPAVVRGSTQWFLVGALDGSCCAADFHYGARPLVPLMGDWDGDGSRTPGTFEAGMFKLRNANSAGARDITFTFGDARGFPVAGDFDGSGPDDVAVYRDGIWQVRLSGGTVLAPFTWGSGSWPATVPVSGDWDGDGDDGIGTYTKASAPWNLRNAVDGNGGGDAGSFVYGTPGSSYPVVGDWDADAIETVGVKTASTWALRNTNTPGAPDVTPFGFGDPVQDLPLSWHP